MDEDSTLTPPDPERCQAEIGGAFTLGPGRVRCNSAPTVIVEELTPGPDGQKGSMSLCGGCRSAFIDKVGKAGPKYRFVPVKTWVAWQKKRASESVC